MKKTILALSLLTLIAAGCSTSPVTEQTDKNPDITNLTNGENNQVELIKINQAIVRLNAEINELDQLETNIYAKSLNADPKAQAAFDRKVTDYGSIETLQANIRVLIALKQAIEPKTPVETAANKPKSSR